MARHTLATAEGQAADQLFHLAILEAARNEPLAALASTVGAAVHWTTMFKQRKRELPRDPCPITCACARPSPRAMPPRRATAMSELLRLALADIGLSLRRAPSASVIVARQPLVCAIRWYFGAFQDRAVAELADQRALDLLPGRLDGGIGIAARRFERARGAAASSSSLDQHVGRALAQVDAHAVAGLQQRQAAAGRRFGRGVEDRGRARGARLAAVADAGQRVDALA